jgi:hypothetical protein
VSKKYTIIKRKECGFPYLFATATIQVLKKSIYFNIRMRKGRDEKRKNKISKDDFSLFSAAF